MKESEVKRALERVAGFYNDVLSIIDRRCNTSTEHLQKYVDNAEGAFIAIKALCDYAIDDGGVDLTDELTLFHDLFQDITFGTKGFIPDSQEVTDDERLHPERDASEHELRHHLFCTLSFRAYDIMKEVRRLWDWQEAKQNKGRGQDEASTVVIDEEAEKELIALFREDLPYKQAKMAPRKLVDSLREVTTFKHKMVTARDFARCSAYFYTYRKGFLKSPYNKWKQFWEQIQKILNLKAPGYNNKCPQLTREYEQKYK